MVEISNPLKVIDHFDYETDLSVEEILSKTGPLGTPLPSACEVKVFDETGTLVFWLMGDYVFRFMLDGKARIVVAKGEQSTRITATYVMTFGDVLHYRLFQAISAAMGVGLLLAWISVIRQGWSEISRDNQGALAFITVIFVFVFHMGAWLLVPASAYPSRVSSWIERTLELRLASSKEIVQRPTFAIDNE